MEDVLVRRPYWTIYFLVYVAVAGILLGLLWGDLANEPSLDRMVFVSAIFGVSAGASAGVAILSELVGSAVMLIIPATFKWIKDKGRQQGRQEGRKEAIAELNTEWDAWLARYREAQATGREFTESPPSARNGTREP